MANLIDDFGNALKTTISNASSLFTALGGPGGTLAVEYKPESETQYPPGAYGRCLVTLPEDDSEMDPIEGTDYDESCQSLFNFDLQFDLRSVKKKQDHRAIIAQAVHGAFRDRGADFFANFTDNGSNIPAKGIRLFVGRTTQDQNVIDGSRFRTRVSVLAWHRVPLA
jgi:hypothetical protein